MSTRIPRPAAAAGPRDAHDPRLGRIERGGAAALPRRARRRAPPAGAHRAGSWSATGSRRTDFAAPGAAAPANARVERARPDFRGPARGARTSSSGQAGYNTVDGPARDGHPGRCSSPSSAGSETEQRLRAERLARERPGAPPARRRLLDDARLAAAMRGDASPIRRRASSAVATDGAARTVAILEELAAARGRPGRSRRVTARSDAGARRAPPTGGRTVDLWWRDDDAVAPTPALDRLLALARGRGAAARARGDPGAARPSLAARLAGEAGVRVLVHGWRHRNHAPPGAKSAEFGAAATARRSRPRPRPGCWPAARRFGDRVAARLRAALEPDRAGRWPRPAARSAIAGLSVFGAAPRRAGPAPASSTPISTRSTGAASRGPAPRRARSRPRSRRRSPTRRAGRAPDPPPRVRRRRSGRSIDGARWSCSAAIRPCGRDAVASAVARTGVIEPSPV